MSISISQAISSLRPGAQFTISNDNYSQLNWFQVNKQDKPTREEINQEIKRLQQEIDKIQYQRDREISYPPIQDQLDILYHQGYDGWKSMITEIKNKYPKPEL